MSKKILWVVGSINQIGGGERLLLEGVKYYDSIGVKTKVVTWEFNKDRLFGNEYKLDDIEVLGKGNDAKRSDTLNYAFNRFKSVINLLKITRDFNPEILLCQSEYDAIIVGIIAKILNKKFIVLIFGQTYQFPHDNIKYSKIFKKHLNEIVNSCQGYKDTISLKSPKLGIVNYLLNESLAYLRYYFIRKAYKTFTLSKQVKWEVEKIYGIKSSVLRAGFSVKDLDKRKKYFNKKNNSPKILNFLMVNRLVKKKRVDIAINTFKELNNNYKLTIVGSGVEYDNLKKIIINNELQNKINLTGRISDEDLKACYINSDFFISLDVADFDISVVEAMSYGLKIIVSSDFVIDEDFKNYNAIESISPTITDLSDFIKNKINNKIDENVNMKALDKLTWEHYFSQIIK
jgi:glycosyltransferase involved in cell wall biosynthesis